MNSEFGLAHLKGEGKPIHPDDVDCVLTPEQYNKQLAAYNSAYGIKEMNWNLNINEAPKNKPLLLWLKVGIVTVGLFSELAGGWIFGFAKEDVNKKREFEFYAAISPQAWMDIPDDPK